MSGLLGGIHPLNPLMRPQLLVENVSGSSQFRSVNGSFLSDYESATRQRDHSCAASGCISPAVVGGHVRLVQPYNPSWQLIPLCAWHNARQEPYPIKLGVTLVPARGTGMR